MGLRRAQDRRRLHATRASADHRKVGRRVRAACTLAKLTLLDAARATGISHVHLVAAVGARESLTRPTAATSPLCSVPRRLARSRLGQRPPVVSLKISPPSHDAAHLD
ncbi:MAG: hypothetical protein ACLPTJ_03300 [Solirubrobacteraceae bacterium]